MALRVVWKSIVACQQMKLNTERASAESNKFKVNWERRIQIANMLWTQTAGNFSETFQSNLFWLSRFNWKRVRWLLVRSIWFMRLESAGCAAWLRPFNRSTDPDGCIWRWISNERQWTPTLNITFKARQFPSDLHQAHLIWILRTTHVMWCALWVQLLESSWNGRPLCCSAAWTAGLTELYSILITGRREVNHEYPSWARISAACRT